MRYVARYHTQYRRWFVFDLTNQTWGTYGYAEKHTANKRADKLNGAIFAAKAKIKSDFGMVHAGEAPPPRAFKED